VTRKRRPRRPALRGLFARFFALVIGAVVAAALIVGMQVPLLHPSDSVKMTVAPIVAAPTGTTSLVWPSLGSAAIDIPSLGVQESWHSQVVPIASLTKMMTAYVVLKKFPLSIGETGPCITVSDDDVATYDSLSQEDQSSVVVYAGESLCENDLLNGLLVHSASNYAVLLANMVAGNTSTFVAMMNQTAASLGLTGTTYVDVSGYDPGSVSTALDQARLAVLLMKSPLVRSIVDQPSVTLSDAGTVDSFTPDVGTNNVIGVKSGRTYAAGGCDVMAMTFTFDGTTRILYAVVLGQEGGDLLGPAGDAALALANSARTVQVPHVHVFRATTSLGTIGWGSRRTTFGVAATTRVTWSHRQRILHVRVRMRHFSSAIHRGEIVGWLSVYATTTRRLALVANGNAAPLTLWQRLR
jgi:serine-type D-Ala-D-Ala carboxypeptidase (penicillin-binding protein 5/6)